MSINAINSVSTVQAVKTTEKAAEKAAEATATTNTAKENTGVVYEKSTAPKETGYVKKNNSAIVKQLQADAEARTAQLKSLVQKMMTQQGTAIGKAGDDSIWRFLAKGDYTVTPEVKAQAQADIAEDGYWGVNQTSDRIVDFAKALSNDDPKKAEEMLEAFKKGFKAATAAWGDKLPDISQRTYDAVIEKFEAWKNGDEKAATEQKTDVAKQV